MTLPNFLIIGANKAGTTSLYRYLEQHPEVYLSPVKEPSYFAPITHQPHAGTQAPTVTRTLNEYTALFDGVTSETAIGESSTIYLTNEDAPRLIRKTIPEARLVAILRNPVDRAFSDYSMHRDWGDENISFAEAIASELDGSVSGLNWLRRYVEYGFYGAALTRHLDFVDRDQMRVYLYDDLRRDSAALMRDLFAFVGVSSSFTPDVATRYNVSRHPPRFRVLDRALRLRPVRTAVERSLPQATVGRLKDYVNRRNSVRPELQPEIRQRLIDVYRDDVAVVEQIIDRDLSSWLV
jgi:hypothetical protein